MKEDERIILLKHEDINEGIMISRNEAIRRAKGKYITVLDADDTLLHKDILNYSLTVATMANLDVVEFYSAVYSDNVLKGYYHFHGLLPIVYQPELKNKFIIFKDEESFRAIKCRTLWGKIVRNEIFQKALDNIPDKYLYDYILGFEDTMITVSLYQVAQSYYGMRQPGYYYTFDEKRKGYPRKKKVCKQKKGIIKDLDHLKFLQFLIDKLEDNEFDKQIIYHELKAINKYGYSNFKKTVKHHFEWAYKIFDELINSKYLNIKQKEKVLKIKEEVKENEKNQTTVP
jgi:glycosyltransferase involved in cell wall biosynthesis